MTRMALAAVVVAAVVTGAPPPAAAQKLRPPGPRQGYFFGGGFRGGGQFLDAGQLGRLDPFVVFGGVLRGGEMVNEWLGFGGQVRFAGGSNEDFSTFYGAGMMEGQVQPWKKLDLAFRLALGAYGQNLTRADAALVLEDDPGGAFGPIVAGGASYDFFPFRKDPLASGGLALAVVLDAEYLAGSDIQSWGIVLGLEVLYYAGLKRYKLELPVEEAFEAE